MSSEPLLRVQHLNKTFGKAGLWRRGPVVHAVRDLSFTLHAGETLALVGESGSGKSTVGRLLARLQDADSGHIDFAGQRISGFNRRQLRPVRQDLQIIFQDPFSALNPRMRVADYVAEPFVVHGLHPQREARAHHTAELLRQVGLDPALGNRLPHQFSGGQRQRLCIARALALSPRLIIADEPITALDVSIQAQIINLLQDIQARTGVALLFISHDLSMVRHLSQRVAVMNAGRIVELASTEALFARPRHPYTQALLSAVPLPDPRLERARQRLSFDAARHPWPAQGALCEVAPDHFVFE